MTSVRAMAAITNGGEPVGIVGFLPPKWAVVVDKSGHLRRADINGLHLADTWDWKPALTSATLAAKAERRERRLRRIA